MAITRDELMAEIKDMNLTEARFDKLNKAFSILPTYSAADISQAYHTAMKVLSGYHSYQDLSLTSSVQDLIQQSTHYRSLLQSVAMDSQREAAKLSSIANNLAEGFGAASLAKAYGIESFRINLQVFSSFSSMLEEKNRLISKAIDSLIQSSRIDLGNYFSFSDSTFSELMRMVNPYHNVEIALGRFYEFQFGKLQDALGPLRQSLAQITCDVASVKVDIAQGDERVIQAEYHRAKVIEFLSAIIVVKEEHKKPILELEEGDYDFDGLFDCLHDHDTHLAEYPGEVNIRMSSDEQPVSLIKWYRALVSAGELDEEKLEEIDFLARRSELFFRRNFPKVLYHGLWFLGEASVCHALDDPLDADEYRLLERRMGDSIRKQLPRPTPGGNTRGGDAWEKVSPVEFAKRVDELYDLAEDVLRGYNKYKANAKWLDMFKLSDEFAQFTKTCPGQVIEQVALLIPSRLKASQSKKHKHGSTPLAFACELAARDMNIVKKDGKWYGIESLLKKYRAGGGTRGKRRVQAKTRRKTSKALQSNPLQ